MQPSSPNVPCRTGTKTSTERAGLKPGTPARRPERASTSPKPWPTKRDTSVSRDRSGPPPLNDSLCQRSSPIHQRSRLIDVDRHRSEPLRVERVQDLQPAHDRDVVLERAAAEQHGDRSSRAHDLTAPSRTRPPMRSYRSGRSFSRITASPSFTVSRSQRKASARFGTGDKPRLASGVAMSRDERLAVGVGHDERVVADAGRFARQRPVDVELLRAELDDAWRREEPPRHRQRRRDFERRAETELVRVVGVANPRDAALLDDLEPVRHRLQRPQRGDDDSGSTPQRGRQRERAGEVQDDRPSEQRREAQAYVALSRPQHERRALCLENCICSSRVSRSSVDVSP